MFNLYKKQCQTQQWFYKGLRVVEHSEFLQSCHYFEGCQATIELYGEDPWEFIKLN